MRMQNHMFVETNALSRVQHYSRFNTVNNSPLSSIPLFTLRQMCILELGIATSPEAYHFLKNIMHVYDWQTTSQYVYSILYGGTGYLRQQHQDLGAFTILMRSTRWFPP